MPEAVEILPPNEEDDIDPTTGIKPSYESWLNTITTAGQNVAQELRAAYQTPEYKPSEQYGGFKQEMYIDTTDFTLHMQDENGKWQLQDNENAQVKVRELLKYGARDTSHESVNTSSVKANREYQEQSAKAVFEYISRREGAKLYIEFESFDKILKQQPDSTTIDSDQLLDFDDDDDLAPTHSPVATKQNSFITINLFANKKTIETNAEEQTAWDKLWNGLIATENKQEVSEPIESSNLFTGFFTAALTVQPSENKVNETKSAAHPKENNDNKLKEVSSILDIFDVPTQKVVVSEQYRQPVLEVVKKQDNTLPEFETKVQLKAPENRQQTTGSVVESGIKIESAVVVALEKEDIVEDELFNLVQDKEFTETIAKNTAKSVAKNIVRVNFVKQDTIKAPKFSSIPMAASAVAERSALPTEKNLVVQYEPEFSDALENLEESSFNAPEVVLKKTETAKAEDSEVKDVETRTVQILPTVKQRDIQKPVRTRYVSEKKPAFVKKSIAPVITADAVKQPLAPKLEQVADIIQEKDDEVFVDKPIANQVRVAKKIQGKTPTRTVLKPKNNSKPLLHISEPVTFAAVQKHEQGEKIIVEDKQSSHGEKANKPAIKVPIIAAVNRPERSVENADVILEPDEKLIVIAEKPQVIEATLAEPFKVVEAGQGEVEPKDVLREKIIARVYKPAIRPAVVAVSRSKGEAETIQSLVQPKAEYAREEIVTDKGDIQELVILAKPVISEVYNLQPLRVKIETNNVNYSEPMVTEVGEVAEEEFVPEQQGIIQQQETENLFVVRSSEEDSKSVAPVILERQPIVVEGQEDDVAVVHNVEHSIEQDDLEIVLPETTASFEEPVVEKNVVTVDLSAVDFLLPQREVQIFTEAEIAEDSEQDEVAWQSEVQNNNRQEVLHALEPAEQPTGIYVETARQVDVVTPQFKKEPTQEKQAIVIVKSLEPAAAVVAAKTETSHIVVDHQPVTVTQQESVPVRNAIELEFEDEPAAIFEPLLVAGNEYKRRLQFSEPSMVRPHAVVTSRSKLNLKSPVRAYYNGHGINLIIDDSEPVEIPQASAQYKVAA